MSISQADFDRMQARVRHASRRHVLTDSVPLDGVKLEIPLHKEIMDFCKRQWPNWKYIHARTDERSTIQEGAPDFVLFLPRGGMLCIECKTRTGKLTAEQQAWQAQMQMLGHTIHVVRSMEQFLELVSPT